MQHILKIFIDLDSKLFMYSYIHNYAHKFKLAFKCPAQYLLMCGPEEITLV